MEVGVRKKFFYFLINFYEFDFFNTDQVLANPVINKDQQLMAKIYSEIYNFSKILHTTKYISFEKLNFTLSELKIVGEKCAPVDILITPQIIHFSNKSLSSTEILLCSLFCFCF